MKKFKIQLTGFDIGMIIAFAVVGLLGGAAWWYLSGALQAAQAQDAQVKSDFDASAAKGGIIVSPGNAKILQANGDLLKAQVDPVISTYLLPKENGISTIAKEDPVAWKHDLDEDVRTLTTDARSHAITLPDNFYFGFSRYLTESPNDEATATLSKQRAGIKTISEILINAKINALSRVRRTYEEDPHAGKESNSSGPERTEGDQLGGYAVTVPGGTYTAYPFEFEFDTTAESLRPVVDELVKSPYLFIVRTIEVHNEKLTSPMASDLDKMAGTTPAAPSVVASAPGEVAASTPTVGPQYLFGNTLLHVKLRVDMIEWNAAPKN
jgi:hypothetical protein